jgi:integrase
VKITTRTARGRTTYILDCYIAGRRIKRTLKAKSSREANAEGARLYAHLDANRRIAESAARRPLDVRTLLDQHRARPCAQATRVMEEVCTRELYRQLGHVAVRDLTRQHIDGYQRSRQGTVSNRTINIETGILRAALNRALDDRRITALPLRIKGLPTKSGLSHVLGHEEIARLIQEAQRLGIGDEVTVQFCVAGRRGALFSLRWGQVDLRRGTVSLTQGKHGGTGDIRQVSVPLTAAALEVLKRRYTGQAPDKLVFGIAPEDRDESRVAHRKGARGHHLGTVNHVPHRFRHKLKAAAKAAGISWWKELRPHDLRHAAATQLFAAGVPVADVARILGHRSPQTTLRHYAHAVEDHLRDAISALEPGTQTGNTLAKKKRKK